MAQRKPLQELGNTSETDSVDTQRVPKKPRLGFEGHDQNERSSRELSPLGLVEPEKREKYEHKAGHANQINDFSILSWD